MAASQAADEELKRWRNHLHGIGPIELVHSPRFVAKTSQLFFDLEQDSDSQLLPARLELIRNEEISRQLSLRESEYTDYHPLRVFVGTWNVNAKKVEESLESWVAPHMAPADRMPDIFVFG